MRTALVCLITATASAVLVSATSTAPSHDFVQVRPKLWRYNGEFAFLPSPAARTPVAVWLVEADSSWILIDNGAASPEYSDDFLAALSRKLSSSGNHLRIILRKSLTRARIVQATLHPCQRCKRMHTKPSWATLDRPKRTSCFLPADTHGHVDHAGLLPLLLDQYPDVPFALHEAEAPFVTGGQQYQQLKGDSWAFQIGKYYMPKLNSSLPASRQILLKGPSGDVSKYVSWVPKGLLSYVHVPGHSPGQIAFIHPSTKSVITGDVITSMSTSFPLSRNGNIKCDNPFLSPTHLYKDMKKSQKRLAEATKTGVDTYFPSHDDGTGVPFAEFQSFAGAQRDEL